jgi:hypothetical protein
MPPTRNRRRVQPKVPKSQALEAINQVKDIMVKAQNTKNQDEQELIPFSKYVATILHAGRDTVPTPLAVNKSFYKRVLYQDTLTVNATGNLLIMGSPGVLPKFGNSSTASCILYVNEAAYNPTSTTNALTGGWNTNILGTNGINLNIAAFETGTIQNFHVQFELTGVSNLNKQGQIHLFEDQWDTAYYGNAGDVTVNELIANSYPVQDLAKCKHYKSVEIANMDSHSHLEYNYIPPRAYADPASNTVTGPAGTGSITVYSNKYFGCMVTNAAVGTTLRIKYDMVIELAVENDFICDYPPVYSKTYVNPDPLLNYCASQTDLIIHTHSSDFDKGIYKEVNKQAGSNRGYSFLPNIKAAIM